MRPAAPGLNIAGRDASDIWWLHLRNEDASFVASTAEERDSRFFQKEYNSMLPRMELQTSSASPTFLELSNMKWGKDVPAQGGFKAHGVIHPHTLAEFDEILQRHAPALRSTFSRIVHCQVHGGSLLREREDQTACDMNFVTEVDLLHSAEASSEMAEAVADGLRAQRHFLVDAASLTGESQVLEMLQPLCRALARVEATKNMAVASKLSIANHCALAAGAMTALLWVTSEDPPRHVRDTLNAVPTYGERLQSQGPTHIEFTAAFTALLRDLGGTDYVALLATAVDYVARWHPCGLPWRCAQHAQLSHSISSSVDAFDALMGAQLLSVLDVMTVLGNGLEVLAGAVDRAMKAQRRLLLIASTHRRPRGGKDVDDSASILLRETEEAIKEAQQVAAALSGTAFEDDIRMVAAACCAMSWPAVDDASAFVSAVLNALPILADRVLSKRYLSKEGALHRQLVSQVCDLFRSLLEYVKRHHKSGLVWNPQGAELIVKYADDRSSWCLSSSAWD